MKTNIFILFGGLIILVFGCSPQGSQKTEFTTIENVSLKHSAYFYKPSLSAIQPKGWVKNYLSTQKNGITGNGNVFAKETNSGIYITVDRLFKDGDVVELSIPMKLNMSKWPQNTAAIEYGPLVFSLGIAEERIIDKESKWSVSEDFPAYNLSPKSDWNYALAFRQDNFRDVISVHKTNGQVDQWELNKAPIQLKVPVRKVKNWSIVKMNKVVQEDIWPTHQADTVSYWNKELIVAEGQFNFTPEIPSREFLIDNISNVIDTITLVPYGFTNLRLTVFPLSPID